MAWARGMREWRQEVADYRVTKTGRTFRPEMLFVTKDHPDGQWLPLNREGFWADPEAYNTGVVTKWVSMRKAEAERAVWRAMKINRGE
jgi:hypothetical protein